MGSAASRRGVSAKARAGHQGSALMPTRLSATVGPCRELDWAGSHCELGLSLHDLWECVQDRECSRM